ncbi:MAG: MFS transporter [Phycisphaerales bacterium]|nr:MFS transporter [Phycisphaerae bacterium]NNF42479.1 MFS transporter [Phycisphaerales bacterium]NNM26451.1 MFS transporter [Phycisphaerales bacterium]
MSPVETAIQSVGRAIGSFHPQAMPPLTRGHYRRELAAWFFLPVMMGAIEGGVVGVIAKNAFTGTVSDGWLNLAVAALSGAPAFANVTSFLWAAWSHGRDKIRFLVGLQIAAVVLVGHIGFAPRSGLGLLMLVVGAIGARMCWSGVVTLRATVWRANFPRTDRASMAGKLATVQAVMLASVGLIIGLAMRRNESSYHLLYPLVAAFGLAGAIIYGRMRMRGHAALLNVERGHRETAAGWRDARAWPLWRIMRDDAGYRWYMACMFIFGIGNLMVTAPLVIMLRDRFGYGYVAGILITSTIPIVMMPLVIPLWSRFLDRSHIVSFRVRHSWAFVATTSALAAAAIWNLPALLWVGAALKGVAIGGGVLAWNLGHHDFAPAERTSQYMGVHVTLTGLRGLIGPFLGVGLYDLFERAAPGTGGWVFGVCLTLNLLGAAGFWWLHRHLHDRDALGVDV